MKNLEIEKTNQTPYIYCNSDGIVKIEGRSFPSNSFDFFRPLIMWAKEFRGDKLNIHIKLEYFNTSTCKQLLSLLRLFVSNNKKRNVTVNWYYEEDDLDTLEIGQHYDTAVNATFNFIEYNSNDGKVFSN